MKYNFNQTKNILVLHYKDLRPKDTCKLCFMLNPKFSLPNDENNIGAPKIQNIFFVVSNCPFLEVCESNNGLFSVAPCRVIALSPLLHLLDALFIVCFRSQPLCFSFYHFCAFFSVLLLIYIDITLPAKALKVESKDYRKTFCQHL